MRRIWVLIAFLVVAILAVTARLFVWPASAKFDRADAVVIFSGGRGERLAAAPSRAESRVSPRSTATW